MSSFFAQSAFTILFLLAQFHGSFSLTPEQRQLINEYVEVYMRDNFVPGLGLSIVENNGSNVLSIGFGTSRIETSTPATSQTLFAIGSISKSVTGVLVAKVLNEKFPELGAHALDTPIAVLAPGFNFTFSDRFRSEFMTFRDLLSHRSCLFNQGLDILLGSSSSIEEYNYRSRYQSESYSFRTSFEYNNNLYSLAGNLIAHIAGTTFIELTSDFFNQLGMSSTRLASSDGSHEELPNMSHAYFRKTNETNQYNTTHLRRLGIIGGAGAILSTSTDMSQYIRFHLNKGRIGNTQVVPEEVLNWVYKVALPIPGFGDEPYLGSTGLYGYGLGLLLGVYEGNPWISHGGYWPPYESALNLYPGQGFGTFITINGPGSTGTYPGQMSQQLLQLLIFEIVHGDLTNFTNSRIELNNYNNMLPKNMNLDTLGTLSKQKVTKQIGGLNKSQVGKRVEFVEPEDIVGSYGSPADADVVIAIESDDSVSINFGTWGLGTLNQLNDTTFAIQWISNLEDDFYSYGNIEAIPYFTLDFSIAEQFLLRADSDVITFYKDRLIDEVPPIPWDPTSCGPLAK